MNNVALFLEFGSDESTFCCTNRYHNIVHKYLNASIACNDTALPIEKLECK